MVCELGMSKELGPRAFRKNSDSVFLGKTLAEGEHNYSEATAQKIDEEISALITDAQNKAEEVLATHKDVVKRVADALTEKESLSGEEVKKIVNTK